MLQHAIQNAEKAKISGGRLNNRSRQATHVDTYMKNQGEGTRLSVGGGERRSLDQHVFVKRRKKFFLLQKRGQILGDLMSNTSDRRLLERLRDVMVWKNCRALGKIMFEHDIFCLVWLYDPEQRGNPAIRKIFYKEANRYQAKYI